MSWLVEAIQFILGQAEPTVQEIGGVTYTDKTLYEVKSDALRYANAVNVSTLAAIVTYIKKNPDGVDVLPAMINILSPNSVELIYPTDNYGNRFSAIKAKCNYNVFPFGEKLDRENFNVALQSRFVDSLNKTTLLQLVGTMETKEGVKVADDGVTQKVVAKTGIVTVEGVSIPNPLPLAPFRTFPEIEQPESLYVFRIHDGMRCALYEADGDMWKVQCINTIKQYFENELAQEIEKGEVIILG